MSLRDSGTPKDPGRPLKGKYEIICPRDLLLLGWRAAYGLARAMFRGYGVNRGYPARDEYGLVDDAALTPNRRASGLTGRCSWAWSREGLEGGICWWEASVGSSEGDSTSFAFFPPTRTPTKPATTSKVPAIISQCGNPNDAIMSLAGAPFSSPEGNEMW